MDSQQAVYVARFGWTGKSVRLSLACVAFLAIAVVNLFAPGGIPWLSVPIGFFAVAGLLMFAAAGLSRAEALRVDERGVTFGARSMRGSSRPTVPWPDIIAVVLWTQHVGAYGQTMPYVGLQLREGAPPLSPGRRRVNKALVPHVAPEVVQASMPVNLWQLDRARLDAAVAAFAPQVHVIDISDR